MLGASCCIIMFYASEWNNWWFVDKVIQLMICFRFLCGVFRTKKIWWYATRPVITHELCWVRGSVPGLGGLKEAKMFLPYPRVKLSIVGNLRDREVACSASDRQGSNFGFCVWRTVSSHSSHHPQEVLLVQFSLYVHKGGLKPDSFHFIL